MPTTTISRHLPDQAIVEIPGLSVVVVRLVHPDHTAPDPSLVSRHLAADPMDSYPDLADEVAHLLSGPHPRLRLCPLGLPSPDLILLLFLCPYIMSMASLELSI